MNLLVNSEKTIAAIATAIAPGEGGIAIIRISGPHAKQVGERLILLRGKQKWTSHKVLYGHVIEEKELIDEVLVLFMQKPRSFTGEDIVEIHCHGGLISVQRVFEIILNNPEVRRANPGEFSQRAVLNGRLNLTQAEAINDLISARCRKAAQLAMNGLDGGIQKEIMLQKEALLNQLCELEARVDFEDDLPKLNVKTLLNEIRKVRIALSKLIEDTTRSSFIKNGLRVAIIGRPNVGKSSLLNLLSRKDCAIVTEFPGTTRDLVESEIVLKGVPITFVDTAGIRKTKNKVETLGINKSYDALNTADIVILVFDLSLGWTLDDESILKKIPKGITNILVGNKIDIHKSAKSKPKNNIYNKSENYIGISAFTGEGEEIFIDSLLECCGANKTHGILISLNERQKDLAALAVTCLEQTEEASKNNLPWDFWTIDLRQAIQYLNEINGEDVTEALLDRIFSRFCIGK